MGDDNIDGRWTGKQDQKLIEEAALKGILDEYRESCIARLQSMLIVGDARKLHSHMMRMVEGMFGECPDYGGELDG